MAGMFVNFNGTSVLQLMSFFLLMYFLVKFLYKPFLNIIDKRREDVRKEYENAEKAKKEAEEFRAQTKKEMDELNSRTKKMYEEARTRVADFETQERSKVENQISSMLDKARREIEDEKSRTEDALKARVITLAVSLASRIIRKEIDEKSKRDFLMQQLAKLGEDK